MKATLTPITCQSLELLVQYRQTPTVALRNKIAEINIGLVRKIAHRIKAQCKEPYDDLEQVGALGLLRAIERFDPSKGAAFSSFAVPFIRGEMLHYLRDRGSVVRVPRNLQDIYREAQRFSKEFCRIEGRSPTDLDVILGLKISEDEWNETLAAIANRSPASLDTSDCQEVEDLPDCMVVENIHLDAPHPAISPLTPEVYLGEMLDEIAQPDNVVYASFVQNRPRKAIAASQGVSPMTIRRRIQSNLVSLCERRRKAA